MGKNKNSLQPPGQLDFLTSLDESGGDFSFLSTVQRLLPNATPIVFERVREYLAQFGGTVGNAISALAREDSEDSKQ